MKTYLGIVLLIFSIDIYAVDMYQYTLVVKASGKCKNVGAHYHLKAGNSKPFKGCATQVIAKGLSLNINCNNLHNPITYNCLRKMRQDKTWTGIECSKYITATESSCRHVGDMIKRNDMENDFISAINKNSKYNKIKYESRINALEARIKQLEEK